jgi:hypothetical protein
MDVQIVFGAHPPNFVLSMKSCKLSLAFFICLLWAQYSSGQFRKYSNEFLNIGAGAKGLSMGGAMVAGAGDATAGYWNPAGLTSVREQPSLSLMHAEYFAGIGKYDFAAIAILLASQSGKSKTLGLSLLRFAVDDIPNTLYLIEPNGSINYNNIISFSSADYAFLISYAQEIFSIGLRLLESSGIKEMLNRIQLHPEASKLFNTKAAINDFKSMKRWEFQTEGLRMAGTILRLLSLFQLLEQFHFPEKMNKFEDRIAQ